MQVTDQHLENSDSHYRYRVVFDSVLKFNECRRHLNQLYGWGWDTRRAEEANVHWAQGVIYRQWTLFLRGDDELVTLSLVQ